MPEKADKITFEYSKDDRWLTIRKESTISVIFDCWKFKNRPAGMQPKTEE